MQDVQGSSPLLPLLRSPFQGELLAWLYLGPERECSTSELSRRFGVSQATVSREADRLVGAGLLSERRRGSLRLLRANLDTAIARPLTDLLAVVYGPTAILGPLLAAVSGIDSAYVYGSWAARYHGEPGEVPRDIDVLVVGEADEDDLDDVARTAQQRLGREVNIRRVPASAWTDPPADPFLQALRSRPLVPLDLTPEQP
jgi:DNA-binding transcriptional ArsR family regulator